MKKKHYKIRITGKVQGVFYRASARRKAEELGLTGWIRNEADGSVYAEAEGSDDALQQFVEWCKKGPSEAQVDEVHVQEDALQQFSDFMVRR